MTEPTVRAPLLVLDTNVVLDWVAFGDARVRPIAAAIERGPGNLDQREHAAALPFT